MFLALTASGVIVTVAVKQALTIIDRFYSGEIPVDVGAVSELAAHSASGSDSLIVNISVLVLGLCWLFGMVDSYRLGIKQEQISNAC